MSNSRLCLRAFTMFTRNMSTQRKVRFTKWKETMDTVEGEKSARLMTYLIDLEEVHKEWWNAGYNERAPERIQSYGTEAAVKLCHHFNIFRHVFNNKEFRPEPMTVKYNEKIVGLGNLLTPTMASSTPLVNWNSKEDMLYTLIMLSPDDHPTKPKSDLLHWCVVNIPLNNLSQGETVASYIPPVPPKGTGFHRQVFVLLEQAEHLDMSLLNVNNTLQGRTIYLSHLMDDCKVSPRSVSFFQCMWDETVGVTLARDLDVDEVQYETERAKTLKVHTSEEKYMHSEWIERTSFM